MLLLRLFLGGFDHTRVDLVSVGSRLKGSTGSDIEQVAKDAARSAVLDARGWLAEKDLEQAVSAFRRRSSAVKHALQDRCSDGPTYESSRKQRPMTPAEYERSLWALRRFKELGYETGCLHVVSAATVGHSLETMRLALFDLGADSVQAVPLFPAGRAARYRAELDHFWEGGPAW